MDGEWLWIILLIIVGLAFLIAGLVVLLMTGNHKTNKSSDRTIPAWVWPLVIIGGVLLIIGIFIVIEKMSKDNRDKEIVLGHYDHETSHVIPGHVSFNNVNSVNRMVTVATPHPTIVSKNDRSSRMVSTTANLPQIVSVSNPKVHKIDVKRLS